MSLLGRIAAAVFSAARFSAAPLSAMAVIVVLMPRLPRSKSLVIARAIRAKSRGPPVPRRDLPPSNPSTVPWPRPPTRAVLPVRSTAHPEICCPLTGRFPVRQQGEELSAYREIYLSLDSRHPRGLEGSKGERDPGGCRGPGFQPSGFVSGVPRHSPRRGRFVTPGSSNFGGTGAGQGRRHPSSPRTSKRMSRSTVARTRDGSNRQRKKGRYQRELPSVPALCAAGASWRRRRRPGGRRPGAGPP